MNLQFSDRSTPQIPTEETMGAQNFYSAFKFQNGQKFWDKKKIPTIFPHPKFREQLPFSPMLGLRRYWW